MRLSCLLLLFSACFQSYEPLADAANPLVGTWEFAYCMGSDPRRYVGICEDGRAWTRMCRAGTSECGEVHFTDAEFAEGAVTLEVPYPFNATPPPPETYRYEDTEDGLRRVPDGDPCNAGFGQRFEGTLDGEPPAFCE